MITQIDHVLIAVRDLAAGVAAYESLLGRAAASRTARDGVESVVVATTNVAVELMAPTGAGAAARRLGAALDDGGDGLKSLVFGVREIERVHHQLERVGLAPEPISAQETWRSFRTDKARSNGMRLFFIERQARLAAGPIADGGVSGLDHVVIRSGDMERAAALYGARLKLDLRLDRAVGSARLMFLRCGDAVVEVAEEAGAQGDRLWGLSWRVKDADAARARLAAAGREVSEVRAGMKRGTRVFGVRDGTCGVPTLMLELAGA